MTYSTTPYCTLAQVKAAMGMDPTNTSLDAWIQNDLLPEAQDQVDDYLGFSYQSDGTVGTPTTRTFSGKGNPRLIIDECQSFSQVLEVTYDPILTIGDVLVSNGSVDVTQDCVLGPANVLPGVALRRLSGEWFHEGVNNYTVAGVWGYTSVPREIERACLRLVIHMVKMKDTNYADSLKGGGTGISTKYTKKLPDDVVEILDRKRRIRFGSR